MEQHPEAHVKAEKLGADDVEYSERDSNKMKVSSGHFRKELSRLRTGRANISIFEDIRVEYYGTLTPVNQLASLGIPDPTLITIQPWDPALLEPLDKAIRAADLGLNPLNDGRTLKVPIPPLDEERRREIAKKIRKMLEEEKTALRNMRRESKEQIEQMERDKKITEDDKFNGLEQLQKLLDDYSKKIEEAAAAKENEILQGRLR
jgi:ribosome recycling factor